MEKEKQKILIEFTEAVDELEILLSGLPVDGFDWREQEDEWSIRQVIHHLADDCNVFAHIIERTLVKPGSKIHFDDFPGNDIWAECLGFNVRAVSLSLELLHAHYYFLAELLRCFPERWQNKTSYYNEEGKKLAEQSVEDIIKMLTDHMREHIQMINNILDAHQ